VPTTFSDTGKCTRYTIIIVVKEDWGEDTFQKNLEVFKSFINPYNEVFDLK
jgi:hypothetical protein